MRRGIAALTGILALLGIVLSVEHMYDQAHYNPGFYEYPNTITMHVSLGALYLGFAMFQFTGSIRRRWPMFHRWLGRLTVFAGFVSGMTALLATILFPFSGPAALLVVGPFAILFLFSIGNGFRLARVGRVHDHREWMIRAMAIGTSIATMRLIFVPSLMIIGESQDVARWLSLTSFGAAFVLHCAVAEVWIRTTRDVGRSVSSSASHAT